MTDSAAHASSLLADLAEGGRPFAVLRREATGGDVVEVMTGEIVDVGRLADLPAPSAAGPVLAMVPFRQVAERGFDAHDDGAPLRCLVVDAVHHLSVDAAVAALPGEAIAVSDESVSVPDDEYAAIVQRVITEEIGAGEGANFVIRRDVVARYEGTPQRAVLTWLRELLTAERGAYWTFAVSTPGRHLVGATPERHVSVEWEADGSAAGERRAVRMNPISGTFRHHGLADDDLAAAFTRFVADQKETEELFMVVDEEMKMMARVCADGGRITGPCLKQMAHLTHTEYLLDGRSELDVREVLRETMFAPTVTGSPMENACTVIARHERDGRGYYSGVLALLSLDGAAREQLDAPILIRTAQLTDDGRLRVGAGATLVRHSDPDSEVAETTAKAAGMLAALGLRPRRAASGAPDLAALPGVSEALTSRNDRLSAFWLSPQQPEPDPALAGRTVLLVDAEDTFTQMLAHQLRHAGMVVDVRRWHDVGVADVTGGGEHASSHDLVLFGPGPGDPRAADDPRVTRLRGLMSARLEAGLPLLAVCLSHQVLSDLAGLRLAPLPAPHQGVQVEVDWFGQPALIGFYNTFSAWMPDGGVLSVAGRPLEAALDPATGAVHGLRGPGLATIQGHAESVLSRDGLATLHAMARHALA